MPCYLVAEILGNHFIMKSAPRPSDQKHNPRGPSDQNLPRVYHVSNCKGIKKSQTNQRVPLGRWCHEDQSGDDTCHFVPRYMLSRLPKRYKPISGWHVAYVGEVTRNGKNSESFQKLPPKMNAGSPIKVQLAWTVRSKSNYAPCLPCVCHLSDGSL